jgi:hypothetical protein
LRIVELHVTHGEASTLTTLFFEWPLFFPCKEILLFVNRMTHDVEIGDEGLNLKLQLPDCSVEEEEEKEKGGYRGTKKKKKGRKS